jgi:hypothetical protein
MNIVHALSCLPAMQVNEENVFSFYLFYSFIHSFWWYWGLSSGSCACKASAPLHKPQLQPFLPLCGFCLFVSDKILCFCTGRPWSVILLSPSPPQLELEVHTTMLNLLEDMGSHFLGVRGDFTFRLASNHHPPDLGLLSS